MRQRDGHGSDRAAGGLSGDAQEHAPDGGCRAGPAAAQGLVGHCRARQRASRVPRGRRARLSAADWNRGGQKVYRERGERVCQVHAAVHCAQGPRGGQDQRCRGHGRGAPRDLRRQRGGGRLAGALCPLDPQGDCRAAGRRHARPQLWRPHSGRFARQAGRLGGAPRGAAGD